LPALAAFRDHRRPPNGLNPNAPAIAAKRPTSFFQISIVHHSQFLSCERHAG